MGLRRKSRELALQFLYAHDLQERSVAAEAVRDGLQEFCTCFKTDSKAFSYTEELITGICGRQQEIDSALARCSHHWRVERMALIDRNILRIATYEMLYGGDVPATVVINEALEIAKRYAEPESVGFINGILDSLQTGKAE
ncbi:MAG: transcription antitermination factor NusB [Candidatus Electrothrix sp. YB6]